MFLIRTAKYKIAQQKQILGWRNFSMRILTRQDQAKAIHVVSQQFSKRQPLCLALYNGPNPRQKSYEEWKDFFTFCADQFFSQPISLGCFDLDKSQDLVGVILGKNFHSMPENTSQKYPKGTFVHKLLGLFSAMFAETDPQYQRYLLDKSIPIVDHWGGVMKDEYLGQNFYHKLRSASVYAAHQANYRYAFGWTSNFKSAKTLKKLGYQEIVEYNVKHYEQEGKKIYWNIEAEQEVSRFWFKKFDQKMQPPKFDE